MKMVAGITSNPAIFEKAIAGSSGYKDILEAPEARTLGAKTLYEKLAVRDIQVPPMHCYCCLREDAQQTFACFNGSGARTVS